MCVFDALLVVVYVLAGASNALVAKWQFQTCVPSIPSRALDAESGEDNCPLGERHFNKPWTQNLQMFVGEFSLLPIYITTRTLSRAWRSPPKRFAKPDSSKKPSVFALALPACCDFLGTGLFAVGLMFVPAAVAQMMKSSMVIFSACLTVTFLRKKLLGFHYVALVITVMGLISVSYAALSQTNGDEGDFHQTVIGLSIIILSIVCNSFQFVFEEYLLSGYTVSAQWVVGLEGLWGILIQSFFLLVFMQFPGRDNGVIEDSRDTVRMFSGDNSNLLQCLALLYMLGVSASQLCGMTITKRLSAVTRCMVQSCQTVLVWLVTLGLFYGGYEQYGSPWTPYSWFQLAGFVLTIAGTMIYNEILKVPFLTYEQEVDVNPGLALWSPKVTDVDSRFGRQVSDVYVWSPVTAHTFDPPSPKWETASSVSSNCEIAEEVQSLEQPLMNKAKADDAEFLRETSPSLSGCTGAGLSRQTTPALFVFTGAEFLRQLSEP